MTSIIRGCPKGIRFAATFSTGCLAMMLAPDDRRSLFFELHRDLPREGPGDDATTAGVLSSIMPRLPPQPAVLDLGCGPGAQTLVLARATEGTVVAVDIHRPFLETLSVRAEREGLSARIRTLQASMTALPLAASSFDLVWSEGAIWIVGFDRALREWSPFLRRDGFLVASELTWIANTPAAEEREFWHEAYPAMRQHLENLHAAEQAEFEVVTAVPLPHASWFTDYLEPLERRLDAMQQTYGHEPPIAVWMESERRQIDIARRYRGFAYMFYVLRKRSR